MSPSEIARKTRQGHGWKGWVGDRKRNTGEREGNTFTDKGILRVSKK